MRIPLRRLPHRASHVGWKAQEDARRKWYRSGTVRDMAMNLRLTEAETEALREKAAEEGRSMQDVARDAIAQYVSDRPRRIRAAITKVMTEDAELLERLAR